MAKAKKKPTKAAAKKSSAKPAKKSVGKSKPKPAPAKKSVVKAGKSTPKPAPAKAAKHAAPPKAVAKKKPAAPKKAPAQKAAVSAHSGEELAKVAMSGDLKVLYGLVNGAPNRDLVAYKWLAVASDFGHADADEMLASLRETLSDADAQTGTGAAHFELGLAYLTGGDGLPTDHDKARSQLASAKERDYPGDDTTAASILQRGRGRLDSDALAVFDAVYDIASHEGVVDAAWGNEHTHNDPDPAVGGSNHGDDASDE
jgi:hypothetical protein